MVTQVFFKKIFFFVLFSTSLSPSFICNFDLFQKVAGKKFLRNGFHFPLNTPIWQIFWKKKNLSKIFWFFFNFRFLRCNTHFRNFIDFVCFAKELRKKKLNILIMKSFLIHVPLWAEGLRDNCWEPTLPVENWVSVYCTDRLSVVNKFSRKLSKEDPHFVIHGNYVGLVNKL